MRCCCDFNENFFQVAETGKRIKSLLNDDVRPVVAQIAECLADWYKRAQTIYLKVGFGFVYKMSVSINLTFFADPNSGEGLKQLQSFLIGCQGSHFSNKGRVT